MTAIARIFLLQALEEARLALGGARRSLLISKQEDVALSLEELAHAIGGELTTLDVVGGHERHDFLRVQAGIDDDGRDAGALGLLDRPHEGALIERGDDDAGDVLADEPLDDLHLLLAVVLAQRALPRDRDRRAGCGELSFGLDGARVDGFPELVRGPLRNHRDRQGFATASRPTRTGGRRPCHSGRKTRRCQPLPPSWNHGILLNDPSGYYSLSHANVCGTDGQARCQG